MSGVVSATSIGEDTWLDLVPKVQCTAHHTFHFHLLGVMTHSRRDAVLFKGRVGEKSECVCVRVCSGRGSWIIMSINTDDETAPVLYRGSAESEPLLGSVAESEGEGEVEALPSKVARIRSLKAVLLTNFLSATGNNRTNSP